MLSTLAAIGFDPQIRGILVVGTGVVVLMGSIWMILATNSGVRLGALLALTAFFGWMVIMGAFWWIRGIGYVGESVSWQVLDFNRADISQSSVDPARDLPDPASLQGLGFTIAEAGLASGVEAMAEFTSEIEASDPDFAGMTDEEFQEQWLRNFNRNGATTLSQVMSVAPDYIEEATASGQIPELNGWAIMSTSDAGEAQSTAGAAIVEHEGFDFGSQGEFKFLDAFRIGGKPTLSRGITDCKLCEDRWERISLWVTNSFRIKNPPQYAVVQLQALEESALVVPEGEAPRFPSVDENEPIISVVMIRDLGNLRFPPAMVTLGSLLIFTALAWLLHLRDLEAMKRVKEFEADG